MSPNVLYEDVRTGVLPCKLLEVLTGKPIKHNANPQSRYHYLENSGAFLAAVAAEGVKLVNIGTGAPPS